MTLCIELAPEDEARLRAAARQEGLDPAEWARRLLSRHIPPLTPGAATLALFEQWSAEDGTDDPAEIAERVGEWEKLKRGLDAHRRETGEEPLFGA